MKNHWIWKLTALVLAVASAAAVCVGACGWALSDGGGLSQRMKEEQMEQTIWGDAEAVAEKVVGEYLIRTTGIPGAYYMNYGDWWGDANVGSDYDYIIRNQGGRQLTNTLQSGTEYADAMTIVRHIRHLTVTPLPELGTFASMGEFENWMESQQTLEEEFGEEVTQPPQEMALATMPTLASDTESYGLELREDGVIERVEVGAPEEYTVELYYTAEQMEQFQEAFPDYLYNLFNSNREICAMAVICGGLVLLVSVLLLCGMAGRKPGSEEVQPGGLNVIPLDVYALCVAVGGILLAEEGAWDLLRSSIYVAKDDGWLWILCAGGVGAAAGLLVSGFCMALAAQCKLGGSLWLRRTLVGRFCTGMVHLCKKAVGSKEAAKQTAAAVGTAGKKGGTALWRWTKAVFGTLGRWLRRLGQAVSDVLKVLPLAWQWLIAYGCVWLVALIAVGIAVNECSGTPIVVAAILGAAVVLYLSYGFGKLRASARKMASGDLDTKINTGDDPLLRGNFRDFAQDLNALGDVCVEAAKEQMKSERMKTELITNVSHDIKTPLTSIINYVDLLQTTDSEEERQEYLEVLSRQSQRLKKLIEDLMEMSKASSGNISAEIAPTDVAEAVSQALGEFADRMERQGLTVVTRMPEEPVMAQCDGKLLWRVLSNVLTNVVKYAMPGTRVYVDVTGKGNQVEAAIKNISAEPLNVSAEELMERFVRGDASRSTEGNGLGLNIAKSLMEVQGGNLDLSVDGDLFKVVLSLRAAEPANS